MSKVSGIASVLVALGRWEDVVSLGLILDILPQSSSDNCCHVIRIVWCRKKFGVFKSTHNLQVLVRMP